MLQMDSSLSFFDIGKGQSDIARVQKYVKVTGHLKDYEHYNTLYKHLTCSCLLAPRTPFGSGKYWCVDDCPVVVERREFVNCTEFQVTSDLVDFAAHGLNMFELLDCNNEENESSVEIMESTRTLEDEQGGVVYEEAEWYLGTENTWVMRQRTRPVSPPTLWTGGDAPHWASRPANESPWAATVGNEAGSGWGPHSPRWSAGSLST